MSDQQFRANVPSVTSENFDDEVVLVNFDSGKYHSIQGAGVDIWQILLDGATLADIQACVQNGFEGNAAEMTEAVAEFVGRLRAESLVVVAAGPDWQTASPEAAARVNGRKAFVAPSLITFTDMQELLQLDPIHEVDAAGWPVPRTDDGAGRQ